MQTINSAQICYLKELMLPDSFLNTLYSRYNMCQWRILWATVQLAKYKNRCSIKNCETKMKMRMRTFAWKLTIHNKRIGVASAFCIHRPWHLNVFTCRGKEDTEEITSRKQRTVKGNCNRISIYSEDVKPLLALTHSFLVQDDKPSDVSSTAF